MSMPDVAALLLLFAFLVWSVVGEAVRSGGLGPGVLDDYAFARDLGTRVIESGHYADPFDSPGRSVVFAYPPPFALFHVALAGAGPIVGPLVYMLILVLAGVAGPWMCLRLFGADRRRLRWVAVAFAVIACRPFVQSDLHHLNSNTLTASLAIGALLAFGPSMGSRAGDGVGGLLLAASLAIKPWAAGIALLLAARGRFRAVALSVACVVFLFFVLPGLVLGPRASLDLLLGWTGILAATANAEAVHRIAVDNVSLPAAALAWGLEGRVAAAVVRGIQAAWLLGIAFVVVAEIRRARAGDALDGRRWLRLGATLLVAPIPLTEILQPHHAVVIVPLAIGVALDGLEIGVTRRAGAARLGTLALVFVLSSYGPAGATRGPWLVASLALLLAAAWWPIASRRLHPLGPDDGERIASPKRPVVFGQSRGSPGDLPVGRQSP
jgi:hypothetical protein